MSTANETGRFRQKAHTRALLVRTAAELIRKGATPTVTEVAEAAEVSRRTAYRYFPSQEQLLAEAAIASAQPKVSNASLPEDIQGRVRVLVDTVQQFVYENQAALRAIVRLSAQRDLTQTNADDSVPIRSNRAEWIRTVLEPVRKEVGSRLFERLVSALTLCVGIESAMVLANLRGLSRKEAVQVSSWAAETLVLGALEQVRGERSVSNRLKKNQEK